MKRKTDLIEIDRLSLQEKLDEKKTQSERNRLGQFATPTLLARDILTYGISQLPAKSRIKFLDPAIGTGSFYSALRSASTGRRIHLAMGFEIDSHYQQPAADLWKDTPLEIRLADFTMQSPPASEAEKANLLICNPPYVRHHHLDSPEKVRLQQESKKAANIKLSGLCGLYCYFMAMANSWMTKGGIAGWLIPSEFMDVNYGRQIKQYLLRDVTLLHIHRFDPNDVQFDDALVSSAVVWFKNVKPDPEHKVVFSYGGDLASPRITKKIRSYDLEKTDKWTRYPNYDPLSQHLGWRLGDLFSIKRGLATGDNSFFILDEKRVEELQLPLEFLQPVLPSTRHVQSNEILSDDNGVPLLDKRLFLINCSLPEEEIQRKYPHLWDYLKTGLENVAPRYLCRTRRVWYSQEKRPAAPIVCTYIGRSDHAKKPFRFLLNNSRATATNVFLMLYPNPALARKISLEPNLIRSIWVHLNEIDAQVLLSNGRVYGGGMHKLEPKELANVPSDDLAELAGLPPKTDPQQVDFIEELTSV